MAKRNQSTQADAPKAGSISKSVKQPRTRDEVCKVRIYLTGVKAEGGALENNITSTLYVEGSKVSQVSEKILKAFGG